jgi:dihydroflavonol-4-reductase
VKVLVTGASGFLGAHLCRQLDARGFSVSALVRETSSLSRLRGLSVDLVRGDITDASAMSAAVRGFDFVINAAAVITYGTRDPADFSRVNVSGAGNVARACHVAGVRRLVHVSSTSAVGIPREGEPPANEQFRFNLGDARLPYHVSKLRGEAAVAAEVGRGLDAVIVNPGWIFGPDGERYRGLQMVQKVSGRKFIPFFRGGICTVHVDDVVDGIFLALTKAEKGTRFILGGENVSYRSIAERARARLGSSGYLVEVPAVATAIVSTFASLKSRITGAPTSMPWATHVTSGRKTFYDSGLAKRLLGYSPRDFDAILDDMFRFAAEHGLLTREQIATAGTRSVTA